MTPTVEIYGMMTFDSVAWYDKDGNVQTLPGNGGHALSVTEINAENNTISYVNPWNSSEIITVDLDDFVALQAEHSGNLNEFKIFDDTAMNV